jgi:hypothetical protein
MSKKSQLGAFLTRHSFLLPLAFALALGLIGWSSQREIERVMKAQLRDKLETILNADVAALRIWIEENKAVAEVHATDPRVRELVFQLLDVATKSDAPREALLAAPALGEVRALLGGVAKAHGYSGYGVLSLNGMEIAADGDGPIGRLPSAADQVMRPIGQGRSVVSPPILWDPQGTPESAFPAILVGAPLRDAGGRVVAGLAFIVQPTLEFARLLTVARPGESGETYAFDADGTMLSESRFADQLREIGVLPEDPDVHAALNVQIRDPGGDMTRGHVPKLPVKARPLTRMAADAVMGNSGSDVDGYNDYRGVSVAGAWTWLPELGIGITTEIDIAEAYGALYTLQRRFWLIIGLLVVGAGIMLLYSFLIARMSNRVEEARQLGRYRIGRKLGSGGMGSVYLASHALLRRPTAIKILKAESAGREGLARFEREVQVSSSLSHPNTIEIYDFGYTPDGTFYYAMEYVNGITLGSCGEQDGPQPEARVLHIMKQICSSIAETHALGLMHRDLKPGNIMLCERGGMCDFVKVLDFGLVREEEQSRDVALTEIASLSGTPLYMPPESVRTPEKVDVRCDIYQLGAITYYLVTGKHVFQGDTAHELLAKHVAVAPDPPSKVLGRPVSPDLESVILRCLEKNPRDRPAHAGELLALFEACHVEGVWGQREARDWWLQWREQHPPEEEAETAASHPSGYTVDVVERLRRS